MKLWLLLGLVLITACTTAVQDTPTKPIDEVEDDAEIEEQLETDWKEVSLKNVITGEEFTIASLEEPVLVESFAVWCPTCTRQQQEIAKVHEENPEVSSVSLDTDPNEDENKVIAHVERNEFFSSQYAISPPDVTRNLIDEFGPGIVNAPQAPVILICNGESTLLGRGLKSAAEIQESIEDNCA